jgi:hypothetical protein
MWIIFWDLFLSHTLLSPRHKYMSVVKCYSVLFFPMSCIQFTKEQSADLIFLWRNVTLAFLHVLWMCSSAAHNLFATSTCAHTCFAKWKYKASLKRAALTVEHRMPWISHQATFSSSQSRLLPVGWKISSKGKSWRNTAARRWLRFWNVHWQSIPSEYEIDLFVMRFALLWRGVLWWFFMGCALNSANCAFYTTHKPTLLIAVSALAWFINKTWGYLFAVDEWPLH